MVSSDPTKKAVDYLITSFINFIDNKENNAVDILYSFSEKESFSRSYSEISRKVYSLSDDEFDNLEKFMGISDDTENYFLGIWQGKNFFKNDDNVADKIANLQRLERHITLSCYQREYISKTVKDAENTANKAVKNSKKAQKKVKGIYSEFVGILGIFTAMSFAMMGSVEILGNLFSDLKDLSSASLGYAFIVGGVYLIVIYLIILMLFIGIKKLFADGEYQIDFKFCLSLLTVSIIFFAVGIVLLIHYT